MVDRPAISIGMPVYNAEDLLPETLDSVLSQTFEDLEVVISDNASTDSTPDICRAYAERDQRVRYERNKSNIGIPPNFNRVFRLSRAPFFKWQAHDDLLHPDFLKRCTGVLNEDPTTVLVGARVGLIEQDGSPVRFDTDRGMFITSYGEQSRPGTAPDTLASPQRLERFRSVVFDVAGPLHAELIFGLFRSRALARTPLMEGYIGAEKVLMARLSLIGRFREVPEELFLRRLHPRHASAMGGGTWKGQIQIARTLSPDRRLILFPLARQVRGYVQAVNEANISSGEKVHCWAMIAEKVAAVGIERVKRMATNFRGRRRNA